MEEKSVDIFTCILSSIGMIQNTDRTLFIISLISTIIGATATIIRQVIIPIVKKFKAKDLKPKDVADALKKTGEIIEDVADDGKINGSNKN